MALTSRFLPESHIISASVSVAADAADSGLVIACCSRFSVSGERAVYARFAAIVVSTAQLDSSTGLSDPEEIWNWLGGYPSAFNGSVLGGCRCLGAVRVAPKAKIITYLMVSEINGRNSARPQNSANIAADPVCREEGNAGILRAHY